MLAACTGGLQYELPVLLGNTVLHALSTGKWRPGLWWRLHPDVVSLPGRGFQPKSRRTIQIGSRVTF